MQIPINTLEADTLTNIIEHFVLREGSDYGAQEYSFADKVQQVRQQLESGEAVLTYSELHESINIVSAQKFTQQRQEE